jgi:hypothetical protein
VCFQAINSTNWFADCKGKPAGPGRRVPNIALFEAFYNYCFVPKHTIGTQLLTVRRDKREREAFAATQEGGEIDDEEDDNEGGYRVSLGGGTQSAE